MPYTDAERKMFTAMVKHYGSKKKGEQVYHATMNKREGMRAPRLAGKARREKE